MGERKNLSDQLNEYSADDEILSGINFSIHKNVMIWGGTIIQLSNVSSISRYNKWENTEENYFEKVERNVGFGEFIEANKRFKYAFWGAILSFIIGIFVSSFFLIPFLALAIWVGYSFWERHKITINVPQTKSNRICHYMICIIVIQII